MTCRRWLFQVLGALAVPLTMGTAAHALTDAPAVSTSQHSRVLGATSAARTATSGDRVRPVVVGHHRQHALSQAPVVTTVAVASPAPVTPLRHRHHAAAATPAP